MGFPVVLRAAGIVILPILLLSVRLPARMVGPAPPVESDEDHSEFFKSNGSVYERKSDALRREIQQEDTEIEESE